MRHIIDKCATMSYDVFDDVSTMCRTASFACDILKALAIFQPGLSQVTVRSQSGLSQVIVRSYKLQGMSAFQEWLLEVSWKSFSEGADSL